MKTIINKFGKFQLSIGLIIINLVLVILYTPSHFYFEMIQSYAFQFLLLISVIFSLFVLSKKWIGALTSFLAIIMLLSHLPLIGTNVSTEANISIAHFNVLKLNDAYEKTIQAAISSNRLHLFSRSKSKFCCGTYYTTS